MQVEQLFKQSIIWRGLTFVVLLLLNVVVGQIFEAATTGLLFFYTNVFALFVLLGTIKIENSFTYFGSNLQIKHHALAWLGILFTLFIAVLLQPLILLYGLFFKSIVNMQLYASFYCVGIILVNIFTALFYSQNNFKTPSAVLVISNLVLIFWMLYWKYLGKQLASIEFIYFLFFLLQGFILFVLYAIHIKIFSKFQLPTKAQIKKIFTYALSTFWGNIIFFFVYKIDYWFVQNYCSNHYLGNYIQASKMAQVLLILPQILASVVYPQTAAGANKQQMIQYILRWGRLFVLFLILVEILLVIVGNTMFTLVFGSSFNFANQALIVLIPGIAAIGLLTMLSSFFSGIQKAKINAQGALWALLVAIILNVLLVPIFGVYGAAIASSISYITNVVYALICLKKYASFSWYEVVCVKKSDLGWLLNNFIKKD